MNVVITAATAMLLVMVATGTNLQWWLERSDYVRHFQD
jgi:hypothetical protein